MVLDSLALAQATLIVTVIALLSWVLVVKCFRRIDPPVAAGLSCTITWLLLGTGFYCIENGWISYKTLSSSIFERALGVLAEGNDIAFMPLVIPFFAFSSGIALFLGLLIFRPHRQQQCSQQSD